MHPSTTHSDEATTYVTDPAGMLRMASMLQAMRNQAHESGLDDAGVRRIRIVHNQVLHAVRDVVSEDLVEELDDLRMDLDDTASRSSTRLAQAQLVGWLGGLIQVLQASAMLQEQEPQFRDVSQPDSALEEPFGATGQYL